MSSTAPPWGKRVCWEGGKLPWGPAVWESNPSCAEALKERELPLPSVQREGKASCWRGRAVSLSANLQLSSGSMVWCRKTWKMSVWYEFCVGNTPVWELQAAAGGWLPASHPKGKLCACMWCRAGLWEVQLFDKGSGLGGLAPNFHVTMSV